ncbi:hypothetical protein NPIL_285571 [Nephila pilipes]|uniref:Uncharacterized protein n=1 Tax=Nephila pilipes TaxID=299642 RepID=A0A8X6NNY4_NEPPI|nr:hypothetical protein NPIL_285571 [Nephila pilipes]
MDTGRVISADYPESHVMDSDVAQVRDDKLSRSDICIPPSDTEDDAILSQGFSSVPLFLLVLSNEEVFRLTSPITFGLTSFSDRSIPLFLFFW